MSLNNEVFRWLQTCKYGKFITVLKQINTTSWSCTELGVRHCFSASCIRNYNTESSGVQKWIYILDCLILSGASEQKRELSLLRSILRKSWVFWISSTNLTCQKCGILLLLSIIWQREGNVDDFGLHECQGKKWKLRNWM